MRMRTGSRLPKPDLPHSLSHRHLRTRTRTRRLFRQMLRALPLAQSPQEVADAIYNAAATKRDEVVVGLPFAAAAQVRPSNGRRRRFGVFASNIMKALLPMTARQL